MKQSIETLSHLLPQHITLERVCSHYDQAIESATKTVRDCHLNTPEGNFTAVQAIATAYLLKNLLDNPLLFSKPIYKNTGGPEENPHRIIDVVGQKLFDLLQLRFPVRTGYVYIEENHCWDKYPGQSDPAADIHINIDTLDGTSNILYGHRDQASAIMITDLSPTRNRF
ncbi:hypothetical protein A2154_02535 [Candidatus Gottesmanbacteria bacterium RBG_16_43_7]|uniref:Uncharacterized protein n=1 Tax=Candidatus Gottesmanbacteria bacterium RBG_16_43_7 TaxID=1798373 RepID=A0A1F5ZCT7_9BACT|nr:MAG: hypothetical protein A2154_02535 [Candidatus Gottesmanbacteria bacterium RBG_16_43_7]